MSSASWLIVLLFIILPLLRRLGAGAKKGGTQKSAPSKGNAPAAAAPRPAAPALRPAVQVRRKKDDDCVYGEVNHQYSHLSANRVQQVKNYLKAGLIDEKEYHQMLRRYSEQEHYFDRE